MITNVLKKLALIITLLMVLSCNRVTSVSNVKMVKLEELIDSAGKYDGKLVQVKGFASMGFESCILFPSNPELKKIPLKYWVWYREKDIGCGAGEYAKKTKYGDAIIKGIFDWSDKGHLGSLSASINDAEIIWIDVDGEN